MARFFLPKKRYRRKPRRHSRPRVAHLRRVLRLAPAIGSPSSMTPGWEHDAVIASLSAAQGEIEIIRSL